jgi:prophage regulatory protein
MERFLRVKEVAKILGIHVGTVYRFVRENKLPKPRKLSGHVTFWLESEIEDWVNNKLKEISIDQDNNNESK